MADLKKVPFNTVHDDVVSMSFDENPNIPTANYSDETAKKMNEVIKNKMRAEKIKKMIEAELKDEKKTENDELSFNFGFGSM